MAKKSNTRGNAYAEMQSAAQQAQNINSERLRNVALERQEQGNIAANMNIMAEAGGLIANDMGSSTAATLGKYGYNLPKVNKNQTIKMKPNNIQITNNNITTNNITGGSSKGDNSAAKFKTWVSNSFARQKEESARREKEYNKREWSLSKTANKMLRKMESASRDVAETLNPKNIGQTVGNQMKMLMMIFGVRFLAKNWTKVLKITESIYTGIANIAAFFGIGDANRVNQLKQKASDFRGVLIKLLGGNPNSTRPEDCTIIGRFKQLFDHAREHLQIWLEGQMEIRGLAMKSVKFPNLKLSDFSGKSGGDPFGIVSGLSNILSKTFSGVTEYLGNMMTVMINPKAGAMKGIQSDMKNQSIENSRKQSYRDRGKYTSEFDGDERGNHMYGEYALVMKNKQGRTMDTLMHNALDNSGNLNGSYGASISQGRDLLGTIRNARETGQIDIARFVSGLERLQKDAEKKGTTVVDGETLKLMFGSAAGSMLSSGKIKKVPLKVVDVKTTEEDRRALHERSVNDYNDMAGGAMQHIVGGGMTTLLGVGGAMAGGGPVGAVVGGSLGAFIGNEINKYGQEKGYKKNYKENTLKWVPVDDPRQPAIVNGYRTGPQIFYALTPEAIKEFSTKFGVTNGKGFVSDNYNLLIPNAQDYLINKAGGRRVVDAAWNNKGKKLYERQSQDYDSQLETIIDIKNKEDSLKARLDNSDFMQDLTRGGNFAKELGNGGINWAKEKWEEGKQWLNDLNAGSNGSNGQPIRVTLSRGTVESVQQQAKGGRVSYTRKPGPVSTSMTFNVNVACKEIIKISTKVFINSHIQKFGHTKPARTPAGECALHVRMALAKGLGIPSTKLITSRISSVGDAHMYSAYMPALGFSPIPYEGYTPQKGDVHVLPPLHNQYGHICMFTGDSGWYSDFKQSNMWGGNGYASRKAGCLFRAVNRVNMSNVEGGDDGSDVGDSYGYTDYGNTAYYGNLSPGGEGGSFIGGDGGSYYSGGGGENYYGGSYSPGVSLPVNKNKGEWFNQHKERWKKFLVSTGVDDKQADKIATFYAAQDGVESGGGTSSAARNLNNWGGMQKGGKNINYSSFEEYAAAKHKMMVKRFGYALQANDVGEYVRLLGDPNKTFLYFNADNYNHKTKEGLGSQMKLVGDYVRLAEFFANSGSSVSGGSSYVIPSSQGEVPISVPQGGEQLNTKGESKPFFNTDPNINKTIDNMKSIKLSGDLWKNYNDLLAPSFTTYENWEKWFLGQTKAQQERHSITLRNYRANYGAVKTDPNAGKMSTKDFLIGMADQSASKYNALWNQWKANNTYRIGYDFADTWSKSDGNIKLLKEISGDSDVNKLFGGKYSNASMLAAHVGKKHVSGVDSEDYKKMYQKIFEADEDIIGNTYYNDKIGASVLYRSRYTDLEKRKRKIEEEYENGIRKGSLMSYTDERGNTRYYDSDYDQVIRGLKNYESGAGKYTTWAKGKDEESRMNALNATEKYIGLQNDYQNEQDNIATKLSELSQKFENDYYLETNEKRKEEIEAKFHEEYKKLATASQEKLKRMFDSMSDLSKLVDESQLEFYRDIQDQNLKNLQSVDDIGAEMSKLIESGKTPLDAINEMVKTYGEGVLDRIQQDILGDNPMFGDFNLQADDFTIEKYNNMVKTLDSNITKANTPAGLQPLFLQLKDLETHFQALVGLRENGFLSWNPDHDPINKVALKLMTRWDDIQQIETKSRPFGTKPSAGLKIVKNKYDKSTNKWTETTHTIEEGLEGIRMGSGEYPQGLQKKWENALISAGENLSNSVNEFLFNMGLGQMGDVTGAMRDQMMNGTWGGRYNPMVAQQTAIIPFRPGEHPSQQGVITANPGSSTFPFNNPNKTFGETSNVFDYPNDGRSFVYTDQNGGKTTYKVIGDLAYKLDDKGNPIMYFTDSKGNQVRAGIPYDLVKNKKWLNADGGFTNPGGKWDEAGIYSNSIVHAGEWVAPQWMVRDPAFRPMIDLLEKSRLTKNTGIKVSTTGGTTNSGVIEKLDKLIEIASTGNQYASLNIRAVSEGLTNVGTIIANKPVALQSPGTPVFSVKSLTS